MATPEAPLCGCCQGQGMHEHRAYARGASPEDDTEGCTACGESGHTWHDRTYRNSCEGAKTLARRQRRRA